MHSFLKIGHRGAKGLVAENTLESIQQALEFGVDAIEIDVHCCKTGEIVVIHDFTLDRTTNGSGAVANKSFSELQVLKVEGNYKIPLLSEVLDLTTDKCNINIELKGSNTAKATSQIVEQYVLEKGWKYEDFIVSSFQEKELFIMKQQNANIPLGVLSKASVSEAIELGQSLNAAAIHPSLGIITEENVAECHEAGFKVNVWTVNETADIQRVKKFGVDGIISDFPNRL